MTGDQHDIVSILVKHAMHEPLTAVEKAILEQWRERSDEHAALPGQLRDREWLERQRSFLHAPPTEEMWEEIRQYIDAGSAASPVVSMPARQWIGVRWIPAAVLLLGAMIFGGMRFRGQRLPVRVSGVTMPVGYKALLILADGQAIVDTLAKGAVVPGGGMRKADSNSYVCIGGGAVSRQRLVLAPGAGVTRMQWPDGSTAWIKPGTSLDYATDLRSAAVKVEGEAWFRIAPNAARPVTVEMADSAKVQVLGTSFEVRSITGRPGNRVALFSGGVRVVRGDDNLILRPGSQTQTGGVRLKTWDVDSNEALGWLRPLVLCKDFEFRDADLLEMLPEIAAWYRVAVVNSLRLRGVGVRGEFLRTMSLPALIASLNEIEGSYVRIQLREDTIYLSPLKAGK